MNSELFVKVSQREERADRIKPFLVFPVAAFYRAIVSWGIRTDQFMPDAQLSGGFLKKGRDIPFAVREAVGKFKAVVSLYTFHANAPAGIPLHQPLQKVGGGVGGLLRIGGQEAELGKLVNGGVLEQAQLRVCDTAARDHFHIYLDPLSWMGHLLIVLGDIRLFLTSCTNRLRHIS